VPTWCREGGRSSSFAPLCGLLLRGRGKGCDRATALVNRARDQNTPASQPVKDSGFRRSKTTGSRAGLKLRVNLRRGSAAGGGEDKGGSSRRRL